MLEQTANRAENYGVVIRHQMETDMLHDNLFGLTEKFVGAAKDKNTERAAEAAKDLKESAKKIRSEFALNDQFKVGADMNATQYVFTKPA